MDVTRIEVEKDETLVEGGYLRIRRLEVRLAGEGGARTAKGTWDFVERPAGLDAVVVALWHRGPRGVEVLLRDAVRVPLHFGRPEKPARMLFTELVAGIVEKGEDGAEAIRRRAAEEVKEEAGLEVPADSIRALGLPVFPTPGMCAEQFHLVECEVTRAQREAARAPSGDGSPFEEGARTEWVSLDEALSRCARGIIRDAKTELGLRRLRERV